MGKPVTQPLRGTQRPYTMRRTSDVHETPFPRASLRGHLTGLRASTRIFMGNLGATELILIFLVVLLLFGARRIPEIARGLGKGIREFKDATSDVKRELMVDDTRRLQPPTSGQPLARGAYDTPQYAEPTPAYAPPQAGYASPAPTGPTGDPDAGIPSTGVPGAPYPPVEANDQPPPHTPPAQG